MNDIDLLDKAKQITGSDAGTGQKIGLSKQNVSHVRNGRRALSPSQAGTLAELIGLRWHDEALPRLAALEATQEGRRFWEGKSQQLASILTRAAGVIFLIIGGVLVSPTGNASDLTGMTAENQTVISIVRCYRSS